MTEGLNRQGKKRIHQVEDISEKTKYLKEANGNSRIEKYNAKLKKKKSLKEYVLVC